MIGYVSWMDFFLPICSLLFINQMKCGEYIFSKFNSC